MQKEQGNTGGIWVVMLLCSVIFILPARFYNGFYLEMFAVPSNISVYYVSLMDLVILLFAIITLFINRIIKLDRTTLHFGIFYLASNTICMFLLIITGQPDYIGELFSKSLIIICAAIFANTINQANDLQKTYFYISPLFILVVASFFLAGYQGYGIMNRTGSIGFGTNETASFACILLAIGLLNNRINMWVRVAISLISIACVFNVASRRGTVFAIVIILLKAIFFMFRKREKKIAIKHVILTAIPILVAITLIVMNYDKIIYNIDNSALFVRFRFAEKINDNVFDYTNRLTIIKDAVEYLDNHFLFGSYGCDLLFAQDTRTHAHNLILHVIVTHGIIFGVIFVVYILVGVRRAILLFLYSIKRKDCSFPLVVSLFFLIYFAFDSFGYLLWNPKGLLWIAIAIIMINYEFRNITKPTCFQEKK